MYEFSLEFTRKFMLISLIFIRFCFILLNPCFLHFFSRKNNVFFFAEFSYVYKDLNNKYMWFDKIETSRSF